MNLLREEIRSFEKKEELMDFLKHRSETDVWVEPFINETGVVHIPNEPLLFPQRCVDMKLDKNGYKISIPDIDTDVAENIDCIECEGGFFMVAPVNGKISVLPMTEYAYLGTCQRTGDDCATMMRQAESSNKKVLPGEEKAMRLTRDAQLYGDVCKMLLRDGYIQTNRSKEFTPFDDYDFVDRLEMQLKTDHPDISFFKAEVSREHLLVEYLLNDLEMEETFRLALNDAGADFQKLQAGVRLTTSDIGMSALRVVFFYIADDVQMTLDGGITMEHKGDADVNKFTSQLLNIGNLFRDCEEQIERLGNIDINDVAGCIERIREKATFLPKGVADAVQEECRLRYPAGGTAIDVYLALNEIIQRHGAQQQLSPTRIINLSEQVAKLMKLPYEKIDAGEDW